MSVADDRPSPGADPGATDELILRLYRCAMAGLCFGDTSAWGLGERLLARVASPEQVGPLFGLFYGFGRALLAAAHRPLSCQPIQDCVSCPDEALAMRIIATAQHSDHAAMLAAASALLRNDDLGGVVQAAQSLAVALARRGLFAPCVIGRAESCRRRGDAVLDPRSGAGPRTAKLRLAFSR
jgi:hypothetical protein